jgi:signal peptidase I
MTVLRRTLASLLFVAVVAGWFVYLRPPILGGSTVYVFVKGTSMEPKYHTGDLVLVRERSSYEIGDIAAFTVAGVGGGQNVVIHRVIAVEADGTHVLQGDNRDQPDPWHPTDDEILGTPLLLLPRAGTWLAALAARPVFLALLCASIAGVLVFTGDRKGQARRRPLGRPIPPILVELVSTTYDGR